MKKIVKWFKRLARSPAFRSYYSEPVLRLVLLIAVAAVDRPALGWLKWNLSLLTAVRASNIVHFAWPIVPGAESALTSVSVHSYSTYVDISLATSCPGCVDNTAPTILSDAFKLTFPG